MSRLMSWRNIGDEVAAQTASTACDYRVGMPRSTSVGNAACAVEPDLVQHLWLWRVVSSCENQNLRCNFTRHNRISPPVPSCCQNPCLSMRTTVFCRRLHFANDTLMCPTPCCVRRPTFLLRLKQLDFSAGWSGTRALPVLAPVGSNQR